MRVSVDHLRVLGIVVNLGLAVGIAAFYANNMVTSEDEGRVATRVKILPPSEFEEVREVAAPTGSEANRLDNAALRLNPSPPRKTSPAGSSDGTSEPEPEPEPAVEEPDEGGPLADEWEYFWAVFDRERPENTRIGLRRKEDTGSSARRRVISRSRSSRFRRRSSRRRAAGQSGEIFFTLGERYIKNEDLDLEFFIVRATPDRLVYGIQEHRGQPLDKYALRRVSSTQYEELGRTEGLWELGPTEEEPEGENGENGEGEDEEPEKFWEVRPDNFEDRTEEDFQNLMAGQPTSGTLRGRRGTAVRRSSSTSGGATAASASGGEASSGGRITDPEERRKALEKLRKETEDLPEEAKQKIKEALQGKQQNGKTAGQPSGQQAGQQTGQPAGQQDANEGSGGSGPDAGQSS